MYVFPFNLKLSKIDLKHKNLFILCYIVVSITTPMLNDLRSTKFEVWLLRVTVIPKSAQSQNVWFLFVFWSYFSTAPFEVL